MFSPRRFTAIRGGRTNPKENKYYHPYGGDLENFKVYLNSREYFNVIFPKLVRYRWRDSDACDETNNDGIVDDKSFENTLMFQTMAATWVHGYVGMWNFSRRYAKTRYRGHHLQISRLFYRKENFKNAR